MATVNFSFLLRRNSLWLLLPTVFCLLSCQTTKRPEGPSSGPGASPSHPTASTQTQSGAQIPESASAAIPLGVTPKIGLILGPGALRAYAHVGIVQEFAKRKLPIQAIAGIEMGAVVAAIYANKAQPYEIEWQMMKLKEEDLLQKSLLSNQVHAGDVTSLQGFLQTALSSSRAENSRIPFACPALQINKQQVYLMNRGPFSEMLPLCMALPPLFKPHQQNVAGAVSLKPLIDFVRSKGATFVIYVDLLQGPLRIDDTSQETRVLWSLSAESLSQQEKGLDHVVHIPLRDIDLLDFSRRRELIQRGQKAAREASAQVIKMLNL